jgi:hypothetical protein
MAQTNDQPENVRHVTRQLRHRQQGLADLRDSMGAGEASWPYLVSVVAGAVGIALASVVGVAELAVGVAAAYVAYDVIARGVPLWDAIRQAEREVQGK